MIFLGRVGLLSCLWRRLMPHNQTLEERFFHYISPEPNTGCWLWTGSLDGHGYGQLRVAGRVKLVSHISLEISGRPRPVGLVARHSCDFPICCNPDHLEWGTRKQNTADAIARGRLKTHGLIIGHEVARSRPLCRPIVACDHCGIEFRKKSHQIREGNRNFFCGSRCSIAWQKANYTNRPISSWSEAA